MLLILAALPFSSCINTYLKQRNLPTLLTPYLIARLLLISCMAIVGFKETNKVYTGSLYTFLPEKENQTLVNIQDTREMLGSKIMQNNETGLNIDGPEQIFYSIMQSPSFLFADTSPLTSIIISLAMIIFSPYMYLYSIEGAAVAYFSSLAVGLDIDTEARRQHCLTGMMICNVLSLHLVPTPASHVAGKDNTPLFSND